MVTFAVKLQPVEVLYESPTTRVFRSDPSRSLICKEPLGEDASRRLLHETNVLQRLSGIEGIARLAPVAADGVLSLHDDGGTLLAHLLQAGPFEAAAVVRLATQLARALAAVHKRGVVHRDVNPSNILVAASGAAVLIDFDLAVTSDQLAIGRREGEVTGTLAYLAPEQSGRTGRAVDQRADLYALGVTLYEMATGRLPFDAKDILDLIHEHLVRQPVPPRQLDARVPRGLSAIVMRLMAKAPEQRYQSAEGLLHDLRRLDAELAAGNDGVFELGERDFPARLAPPRELLGRDAELAALRTAFAMALEAPHGALLVEGAAGVGKSTLINELRPMAAAAGGWFVLGKFDQYQMDAAAGGVTHAARALGRLLLALPPPELAAQRQRILNRLGRNAGLLTRLSSEFGLLLGAQPEVPEVDPGQAERRLQQTVMDLLAAVASPERPLVVVLDDLQWAGPASLRGFGRLVSEAGLRGLLLVGAYRPGKAAGDPAFTPLLAQWSELARPPVRIALGNLDEAATCLFLAKMMRLPEDRARDLARSLGTLTAGNPFDTLEMVNALRADGVIGHDDTGWHWNSDQVRRYVGASNVVDLLAARIARLPTASHALLESMSCLGNSVERSLLAAALGLGDRELEVRLAAPLEDGLLVADGAAGGPDVVRFRHDRVQQAVLGALDDERRMRLQLAMARALTAHAAFAHEAAEQYLPCAGALVEPAEQRLAARLFVDLAGKLAGTATYQLAERYLAAASELLEKGEPDSAMRSVIDEGRHAALYSLGRLDESDPVFAAMCSRAGDPLRMLEPTCLQMRSLFMRGQTEQAKTLGLGLLAQLGLQAPAGYEAPDAQARMDSLGAWVREDSALDCLTRKCIVDERLLAIAKLLGRLSRPAYFAADSKPFQWLLLESQRLWADHGPCPELVASLGRIGSMLITLRGDYRTAYEISRHVLAVGEALGWEPQTSEARFIFATFASHWFEPLENVFRQLTRACEGVRSMGDVSYAGYVHAVLITSLLEIGPTLETCAAEVEAGIALCLRAGNVHAAAQHTCELQALRAMAGRTNDPLGFDDAQFNEEAFLARMGRLPYMRHTYAECRALLGLIMGDAGVLVPNAALGMAHSGDVAGYYMTVYAHFFQAVAIAWQLRLGAAEEQRATLADELESCRAWLAARAADQPANFAHLLRLVEAEQAWALGDLWKAAAAFDAALGEVHIRARPWHRAVITERAGLFQLATGLVHSGRQLLADARDQFEAWGAKAKVAAMQAGLDFLRPNETDGLQPIRSRTEPTATSSLRGGSTGGLSAGALDLVGVLRASQALSSETSLERLTTRVTEVLAALTGATRVHVLAWIDDEWRLLVPTIGESSIPIATAAERGMLPLSACTYAQRTGEALVVDDALADDRFSRDPYFAFLPRCSMLVAPIVGQGATRAMLYLENTQGSAAFGVQRLEAVMLIAGQLAVSLANARLYQSLEERVQERTRELEEMQARLVDTARRAGKAEIANNVLHNVGNVLNSVNVSTSVVRRTIANSRLGGLARAIELIKERERAIAGHMEGDTRGEALLTYLDSLAATLQQEHHEALEDLDRVARSVDHISYVVAAQQSHAGASMMLQPARPQDLLEEALRLSGEVIGHNGIEVTLRSDAAAEVPLDRSRLLQILVNLITNAAQAMDGTPAPARRLTLTTSRIRHDDGEQLRFAVQDTGEGIPADLLTRIFAHGVSGRKGGHGFGLHSCALAAMEMGGKLTAHSDGPGRGATFVLDVPVKPV